MKSMLMVVLAAAAAWGQSVYTGGSTSSGGMWGSAGLACGPPTYSCARSGTATVPLPSPIPNMNNLAGAGTVITDPDFGGRIARVTDSTLDSTLTGATYIVDPGGSGDRNLWNTNSTLLLVDSTGIRGYVMNFNPATMQATQRYPGSFLSGITGGWSWTNPFVFYGMGSTSALVQKYDFTTPTTLPTPTTVFDFTSGSNCLGSGYTVTWNSDIGVSKNPADTIIGVGFSNSGGQGTGVDAVAWKSGSGCTHLNTQTGVVTGDWGTTGTVSSLADRFSIHETKLSKDGKYLIIAKTTCFTTCATVPYLWEIGTLNLTLTCTAQCSGHFTEGFSHWLNNNNSPLYQWQARLFTAPGTATPLIGTFPPGTQIPSDTHAGWNNVDANDSYPFVQSQTDTGSFLGNFPSAWVNEILGLDPTGVSGKVWRFAHTYSTGESLIFDTSEAIGSLSQDGKFYAWSSDWMGTLGSSAGAASCVGGGPNWAASTAYPATTVAACTAASVSNNSCIVPTSGNSGEYVFAATTGGTSVAAPPTWPQTAGATVSDGTATWTNAGKPNCRGDVFVVELR